MGKFDGILFCTDLDGTLYKNDKTVSIENLEAIEYFKSDSIVSEVPETLKSIVRIVPCSSINGSSLLKAFVAEEMIIESDTFKFKTDFFVVAVTNNALSLGEYNCLLNSDIFERGTKINEDKVFK